MIKYFITCIILLFIGCKNSKEISMDKIPSHNSETIVIPDNRITEFIDISDRIKEINIIPLNEEEGKYIGGIDKILIHYNNYIIVDKRVARNVFIFDDRGDFKNQLVHIGRGPSEITQINDVWINDEGEVEIYDFASRRVISYNKDYSFKKAISTGRKYMFANISPLPRSRTYVGYAGYNIPNPQYNNQNYQLTWLTQAFAPGGAHALEYDSELRYALVYSSLSPFARFNDTLRFFRYYDQNIYDLASDGVISKRYILDYGSKRFPQDYETSIFHPNAKILKAVEEHRDRSKIRNLFNGYFKFAGSWLETKNYAMFESEDDKGNRFVTLYDKSNKEVVVQCFTFKESKSYHMYLPFPSTVDDNGRFVSFLPGIILKEYVHDSKSPFYDMVRNNENKNFIIEYTLK